MRVSKQQIRSKVDEINKNEVGYKVTVFERQGLNSILTIRSYSQVLVEKVMTNKEINEKLNRLQEVIANTVIRDDEWRVICRDYVAGWTLGVSSEYGTRDEVLTACSKIPYKDIKVNEFNRVIELYY